MKESFNHPIKNNYLSSGFLQFKRLYNIHDDINDEFKGNKESIINSNQQKQLSEKYLQKNINLSLIQFMQNQDKKHLSTNFNHNNVKKFLKEKEKAMEKIVIEDESLDENHKNHNKEKKDKIKSEIKDKNKSIKFNKVNIENKNNNKNDNNILIFHGTFGEDKFNEIKNIEHHHRHSHFHHHHHHHHHHQDKSKNEN